MSITERCMDKLDYYTTASVARVASNELAAHFSRSSAVPAVAFVEYQLEKRSWWSYLTGASRVYQRIVWASDSLAEFAFLLAWWCADKRGYRTYSLTYLVECCRNFVITCVQKSLAAVKSA